MNWKKVIQWALVNFGVLGLFIVGETTGAAWASNISVFILWITVAVTFVIMFAMDDVVKMTLDKDPDYKFSVPEWLDVSYDAIVLLTLVGFGYLWLAAGYILHMIVISIYRQKIIEAQANPEEPMETS